MKNIVVACNNCCTDNRIPADKQHMGPKCGRCGILINLRQAAVPVDLDDSNFAPFINQATKPVMVDFFSPTCGPCRMMSPAIDNLAKEYVGRVIIAKLDTSSNRMAPSQYQIRGVPTLIFFKNGQVVDQLTGAMPEEDLAQKLNQFA
ncbi:MAG: thioredoxin [Thermodesulfobacteriota bacterium]